MHRTQLSNITFARLIGAVACAAFMAACSPAAVPPTAVIPAIESPADKLNIKEVVQTAPGVAPLESALPLPPIVMPSAGKATATGLLLDKATQKPLVGVVVRLAPVECKEQECGFLLDTSSAPTGVTDATGRFAMAEVAPKGYVMVVGDPYSSSYVIVPEKEDKSTNKARIWTLAADKINDIGTVSVEYKP